MGQVYQGLISSLEEDEIFVFGSNTEGRHDGGTAAIAMEKFGAIYGNPRGLQGRSYALITINYIQDYYDSSKKILYLGEGKRSLTGDQIMDNIEELYNLAEQNPHLKFFIAYTSTGNNINGYTSKEMASFFAMNDIPENIIFEENFYKLL